MACVHRIPSRVRDDAYAPLAEAGRRYDNHKFSKNGREIFADQSSLARSIDLNHLIKFAFSESLFRARKQPSDAKASRKSLVGQISCNVSDASSQTCSWNVHSASIGNRPEQAENPDVDALGVEP
jgi:hypothetical protein